MGIFDRFPYSSTHEMNLDYMLGKATEIAEDMQQVTAGMEQVQAGLTAISEKTEQATQAAAAAAQSASSIEGSVTAAEEAAEEAQMHNESAQTWANNAMTYKADCQRAASEAAASSTAAAQAATAAAASEDTVATYAQAANASAQSAANNNDSAHQYANQANASATNAMLHSSNAQTAATNAQTAATNANTSATNAETAATRAAALKDNCETLSRMSTRAVDLAAEQAVAAANSAAQAAATKTDVENLVESLPEDFTDLNNTVNQLSDEVDNVKDYTYTSTKRVPVQWIKGGIMAATGEVNTSSNLASSPIITNGNYVTIGENWKAVIGFYNNGTYVGKLNPNGGIDKVGGSWGFLTGNNNVSNLLTLANANGYRVCIMPPTEITIANDSEAQEYGESKCVIQTLDIYQFADALQKENDLLKTVLFNESKGQYCIMQYNIGNWYNGTGHLIPAEKYERFYNLQKSIISRYQPDILCMEEFRDLLSTGISAKTLLDQMYTNLVYAWGTYSYDGKGIASNRALFDAENITYTDTESGVHRNYEKCYTYLNGRKVAIIATHMGGSSVATSNIDELLDDIENEPYFIICGDMNVNGNSPAMDKFTAKGYHIANTGNIETTTDQSYLYIDNIITSSNIEIVSAFADYQKEGLEEGSDHYPLLAYVTIK